MFLFPLRVEDAEVDRLPWVSIGIAAACAAMFAITYLVPNDPEGMPDRSYREIVEYWDAHPYLELPAHMQRLLQQRFQGIYQQQHERGLKNVPRDANVEEEQATLNARVAAFFQRADRSLLRRLGFVPERGLLQLGIITGMFLHGGWLHLLGNLFYFYLTGLLLEDRWGRGVFGAFYLFGGIVAATAHYMLDPGSATVVIGASGAIAACMGAFAIRFAARKIRMAYALFFSFRVRTGTFLIPAWVWGFLWFGGELLSFAIDHGQSGVAVMAHIGGFAFGAVTALGLKWSGIEAKYIVPAVEKVTVAYQRPEALDRAEDAISRDDLPTARKELQELLAAQPDSYEAEVLLLKLDLREGAPGVPARAERMFAKLLPKGAQAVWPVTEELNAQLDPAVLRPATAFRVASALDGAPEGLKPIAERYFAAAGREPGPIAAKALVRAAQLRLEAHGGAKVALKYLSAFRATPSIPPDLLARAEDLEKRANDELAREQELSPRFQGAMGAGIELADDTAAESAPDEVAAPALTAPVRPGEVQITDCRVSSMSRDALALQLSDGQMTTLQLAKLLAVAAGVVGERPSPQAAPKSVLVTDLVTSWGGPDAPATVLRLKSSTLHLQNLYPGTPPMEAYSLFLAFLLDQSGATGLPNPEAIRRGEYPRFSDAGALNRALYG